MDGRTHSKHEGASGERTGSDEEVGLLGVRDFSVGIPLCGAWKDLTLMDRIQGGHNSEGKVWKVLKMFKKSEVKEHEAWKKVPGRQPGNCAKG